MEKKVLVYQAYGLTEILQQTKFSILSLLRQLQDSETLEIWVYTDQPDFFQGFYGPHPRLKLISVTMEQVQQWKGKMQFVHRVKIEILRHAASQFKGHLFYCDGDTYFLNSPMSLLSKVNDRTSLMHVAEGALDQSKDPLSKKILKFVKKHHFQIRNELVGIGPSTVMWNAGFIGLSEKNKSLLSFILDLTDKTYELYQKHVMEQLAVSFYLQTHSTILPANGSVYHYWDQKPQYQAAIDQFLKNHSEFSSALKAWDQFQIPAPTPPPPKRSLIQKILKRK